jgi:glycosyltransferase involved in cell wall biosynthesis
LTGHAWEQVVLPFRLRGRILFSPSNTGPLAVSKQIVVLHDMAVFDCPENFNSLFVKWYQFLLPRLVRRVRKVITVSEFTKERICELTGLAADKIAVIPNGVGPQFTPKAHVLDPNALSQLNFPSSEYLLAVGSVEPRKNLRRLLQAWQLVLPKFPGLWLVIAGARGDMAVFNEAGLTSQPPRVLFAGHIPEKSLPAVFSRATGFVYPSLYEGFGLPVLEAMASGIPVVASDRPSIREIVEDAAVLVNPTSVEAIAESMTRILECSTLRDEVTTRGMRRAAQFSWDETAARVWQEVAKTAEED